MQSKLVTFLLPLLLLVRVCCYSQVDYSSFGSIEEVIAWETSEILNAPPYDYAFLSDAHASRGESYLICDRFEEALSDFQKAYDFATKSDTKDAMKTLVFRSLFGQAVVYGNLNMDELVYPIIEQLDEIVSCHCLETVGNSDAANIIPSLVERAEDVPISGPDQISIRDCADLVDNTVGYAKLLIFKAAPTVRPMLIFTLEQLASEARRCCYAGGLWKGCFQKLANKYHQWNQKWKMFGIPPDPAWD